MGPALADIVVLPVFLIAGLLSFALTPAFAAVARRTGLIVQPRDDRWHRAPTPLLGGAAMATAALIVLATVLPLDRGGVAILAAAGAALALGLLDDIRRFAPATKLVGQVLVGVVLVIGGVRVEIVEFAPLAFILTILWVVAILNAINLIDNMDGLAAGITAIAAGVLAVTALPADPVAAVVAGVTAAVALGFLAHNFHPARVFMGDAGSMLLGLLLAVSALLHTARGAADVGVAVLGPLVVLGLPIFDTVLVAVSRWWSGLPISRGGRDHASHRLASLGLSDRAAVVLLYLVAAVLAALGVVLDSVAALALPVFALVVVVLALFGVFLIEVDTAQRADGSAARPSTPRARLLRTVPVYLRFGLEVGLDVVLLTTAYYAAYLIRFDGFPESAWLYLFVQSVAVVTGVQLAALVAVGVYRTLWRYYGLTDAVRMIRALLVGSVGAVLAVLILYQFEGYSRAVFVIDLVVAGALLIGSRAFLLSLRQWSAGLALPRERRVLIVGATDAGVAALQLLTATRELAFRTVGFVDDDPGKRYRRIAGVPIVGTTSEIDDLVRRLAVDLVVLATDDVPGHERLRAVCANVGVESREFLLPV